MPVIIKNLVPGKHYSTGLKVISVGINGDYVVESPFEIFIELLNTGDSVLSNLSGKLTIKNSDGEVTDTYTYPIADKSTIFAGAPKMIKVPVTASLQNGTYTAVASVTYDSRKKDAVGSGQFEVRSDMSTAVGKEKITVIAKTEIPAWVSVLIIIFGLIIIILILILVRKKDDNNKEDDDKKDDKNKK